MNKKYFVLYLLPPRPDFAQTMSDEERAIMTEHVGYWMEHMRKGNVVVFGPVFDPAGVYGMGVVAADDETQLAGFMNNDPAAKINRYEYHPMGAVVPAGQGSMAQ